MITLSSFSVDLLKDLELTSAISQRRVEQLLNGQNVVKHLQISHALEHLIPLLTILLVISVTFLVAKMMTIISSVISGNLT